MMNSHSAAPLPAARGPYGNFNVYCGGKIVMGPDRGAMIGSLVLIVVPSLLCWIYVSHHWAFSVVGAIIMCVDVAFLLKCATTDPGVIPAQPPPPPLPPPPNTPEANSGAPQLPVMVDVSRRPDPPWAAGVDPRNKVEVVHTVRNGMPYDVQLERKWCYTCNLLRPVRASHCHICGCCVERLDHHCPWTSTCVGARNYRYFYGFVMTTTLLSVYVIAMCIAGLVAAKQQEDRDHPGSGNTGAEQLLEGAKHKQYLQFVIMAYGALFLCMVGGLASYHTKLVCSNQTTHEEMKNFYLNEPSPFDRGCTANCIDILCSAPKPSNAVQSPAASDVERTTIIQMDDPRHPHT